MNKPLRGKVAVVAGATRGCGRGIAVELGAAGATVYCTGRSVRGATTGRPETIDETAEIVTAHGGQGIAVRVDHTQPNQVEALFGRVQREQGRLDILVNDIWGGDGLFDWGVPFWEQSLQNGLTMLELAVQTHIITSYYGIPLLARQERGIIFEITDGEGDYYRGHLFYDLAKISVIRLALAMMNDFRERSLPISAVAVTPGYLRSEAMLDHFGVSEENWRDAIRQDADYAFSETPRYLGRAIAALAADPDLESRAGNRKCALSSWDLARIYNFRDIDGRQPHWGERSEGVPA